jgi:hypothetical protein
MGPHTMLCTTRKDHAAKKGIVNKVYVVKVNEIYTVKYFAPFLSCIFFSSVLLALHGEFSTAEERWSKKRVQVSSRRAVLSLLIKLKYLVNGNSREINCIKIRAAQKRERERDQK